MTKMLLLILGIAVISVGTALIAPEAPFLAGLACLGLVGFLIWREKRDG